MSEESARNEFVEELRVLLGAGEEEALRIFLRLARPEDIAEWLDVIRNGGETSCNIERGFEEAISCHMATKSYLEGRQVEWDPVARRIV